MTASWTSSKPHGIQPANVHHTIGFTTEAHMLKPFEDRVAATRLFLEVILDAGLRHAGTIRDLRQQQDQLFRNADNVEVAWTLDTTAVDAVSFSGYAARQEWSPITHERRLRYDRDSLWTLDIRHLHTYVATNTASVPAAFIVPQAWRHVLERLQANGVHMFDVPHDTTLVLDVTHILSHRASGRPYEGHHYPIQDVEVRSSAVVWEQGLPPDQPGAGTSGNPQSPSRGCLRRMELFDSALQQKEYFSAYVFEETRR